MNKRKSGGGRAIESKRKQQDSERNRNGDYKEQWSERYKSLGSAPIGKPEQGHRWLADVILTLIQEGMNDLAMAPEIRRSHTGNLIAQAAKIMDPAKLSAKLAQYERAFEELKAHAAPIGQRENGESRPTITLS